MFIPFWILVLLCLCLAPALLEFVGAALVCMLVLAVPAAILLIGLVVMFH